MPVEDVLGILRRLSARARSWHAPVVALVARMGKDPYQVLVSCIISLRTKDEVTDGATARLFELARTPAAMATVDESAIAEAIYPAGFYRTKAATIRAVSREILERWGGAVPDSIEELLTLKGVGRKTANLVVSLGHGKPAICVDTHVHRIMNRLHFVETGDPDATEAVLRDRLPRRWWIKVNGLLVAFGQRICVPISPKCTECPVAEACPRRGVEKSR